MKKACRFRSIEASHFYLAVILIILVGSVLMGFAEVHAMVVSLETKEPVPTEEPASAEEPDATYDPQPTIMNEDRAAIEADEPEPEVEPAPNPTPTGMPEPTLELSPGPIPTIIPDWTPAPSPSATANATPDPEIIAEPTPSFAPEAIETPGTSLDAEPSPEASPPIEESVREGEIDPLHSISSEPTQIPEELLGDDSEKADLGDGSGLKIATDKPREDWTGVVPAPDGGMPIPRLYQYDYKTVLCKYGGKPRSVMTSGCNVTCVAMVVAYLTDVQTSPEVLFSWAFKNHLYYGNGLGHSEMSKVAANYGVSGRWVGKDGDAVIKALEDGYPVIAHMGPGIFTLRGHYIVLRGVTEEGNILVNDPNSASKSKLAYPISTILRNTKTSDPFMICKAK